MKKKFTTRITALSAALAIIAGSAASCGNLNDNGGRSKVAKELLSASYKAVEIATDLDYIQNMSRIDEDSILISSYNYKENVPSFFISDNDFEYMEPIETDLCSEEDMEVSFESALTADGIIVVLAKFIDCGDAEKPDYDDPDFDYEGFDWDEYYSKVTNTYKLYAMDLEGNIRSESEITAFDEFKTGEFTVGRIFPFGKDNVVCEVYGDEENSCILLDYEGKKAGTLDDIGFMYINNIAAVDENTLAAVGYSQNFKSEIAFVDAGTLKASDDKIDTQKSGIGDNINNIFKGSGDYKLFVSNTTALYGLSEDGSAVEIINWLDSDMGNGDISSLIAMENGDYAVYYSDYQNQSDSGLYRLTKRDVSEIENTKIITIGVMYDNWEVTEKISDYNKSHDDIRIKMVDYSKYDNYDYENNKYITSGAAQLKKDIVSGEAPDMIVCNNQAIIKNLANKGLFADLGEYLDEDSELGRDDIMPNILSSCEISGKLLSFPSSFYINTLAAKSEFVDKQSWTIDEMIETYRGLPEGSSLTPLDCREMIMHILLASMCNAIDYEKRTCNFDTPEFRKLLEFCNEFPKQDDIIDWEDEKAVMEIYDNDNFMKDKQLLEDIFIYDFESYISQYKGRFENVDITYVGYPSAGGNGAYLTVSQSMAILSDSEDKEACWEFIKNCFIENDNEEDGMRYGMGFPTLKSEFDKLAEASTKKPYYMEDGKKIEYEYSYYDRVSQKSVDIAPLTEEEKNKLVDFIMNTTTMIDDFDPDIQEILTEETNAFFEGEKTADEVIGLLQSRISILLSEQG